MKNRGFTLLELIITIALAAILLTLAVPNMRTFMQNNRIAGETNDLLAALNLVRSEAVKRNREAWLCPSQNADATAPTCGGSDWESGWLAVVQASDTVTEVIRAWPGEEIHTDDVAFEKPGSAPDEIRFESTGKLMGGVNPATHADCPNALCLAIEIDYAGCRGQDDLGFRRIVVTRTGGTRVETRDCTS